MAIRGMKSNLRKNINLWHVNQRTKWKIPCLTQEYVKLKLDFANEVKAAVKKCEKNIAKNAKKNPKMVYSYVNSKNTVRDSIRALIDENGKRVKDKAEIRIFV